MAGRESIHVDIDVPIPMRDGVVLRADVYRPDSPGKLPALLMRTPYSKAPSVAVVEGDPVRLARGGYAVVAQDTRGRYSSDGVFSPFADDGRDGRDTVEWVAAQPWSDGRVGMFGSSYLGATQWLTAAETPPHLTAIHPQITASDYHEGWIYQGGALALGFALSWSFYLAAGQGRIAEGSHGSAAGPGSGGAPAPSLGPTSDPAAGAGDAASTFQDAIDAFLAGCAFLPLAGYPGLKGVFPPYYEWLDHPADDWYWRRWSIERRHASITVPAYHIGGWYDIFLGGTLRNYTGMTRSGGSARARAGQRLLIGPWAHCLPLFGSMVGEVDFGVRAAGASEDTDGRLLRWHDHHTAGIDNGAQRDPPVRLFIMGENRWRDEPAWPLERAMETPFYFHGRVRANSLRGGGRLDTERPGNEPPDTYLYDPRFPAPTRGGGLCCVDQIRGGAYDQRGVEERQDVLVYTTGPLAQPLEVTGPIRVVLYASSTAPDTDFTAKLVDVAPCGYARNLTDGIIRARYREDPAVESFLTPGEPVELVIDLAATANLFLAGHAIRVEISSSNFPRFDRNPNTGHPFGRDAELATAGQTVYHDARHPSRILLPLVER